MKVVFRSIALVSFVKAYIENNYLSAEQVSAAGVPEYAGKFVQAASVNGQTKYLVVPEGALTPLLFIEVKVDTVILTGHRLCIINGNHGIIQKAYSLRVKPIKYQAVDLDAAGKFGETESKLQYWETLEMFLKRLPVKAKVGWFFRNADLLVSGIDGEYVETSLIEALQIPELDVKEAEDVLAKSPRLVAAQYSRQEVTQYTNIVIVNKRIKHLLKPSFANETFSARQAVMLSTETSEFFNRKTQYEKGSALDKVSTARLVEHHSNELAKPVDIYGNADAYKPLPDLSLEDSEYVNLYPNISKGAETLVDLTVLGDINCFDTYPKTITARSEGSIALPFWDVTKTYTTEDCPPIAWIDWSNTLRLCMSILVEKLMSYYDISPTQAYGYVVEKLQSIVQ